MSNVKMSNEHSYFQIGDTIGDYTVLDIDCSPRYIVKNGDRRTVVSEDQLLNIEEGIAVLSEEKEIVNYNFKTTFDETGLS